MSSTNQNEELSINTNEQNKNNIEDNSSKQENVIIKSTKKEKPPKYIPFDETKISDYWFNIPEYNEKIIVLDSNFFDENLTLQNLTDNTINCSFLLDYASGGDGEELIIWPREKFTFPPLSTKDIQLKIFPNVYGPLELNFKITLEDTSSNHQQILFHQIPLFITEHLTERDNSPSKTIESDYSSSLDEDVEMKSDVTKLDDVNNDSTNIIEAQNDNLEFKLQMAMTDLSWGHIPLGNQKVKLLKFRHLGPECTIRVQIIKDPTHSFKLLISNGLWVTSYDFKQKDKEVSILKVGMLPQKVGLCTAYVQITAKLNNKRSTRTISLTGYGGEAVLSFIGPTRDPLGKMYFKLGKLRLIKACRLGAYLQVRNDGSLPAFCSFIGIDPYIPTLAARAIIVDPKSMIINPGFSQSVQIEYKIHKSDIPNIAMKNNIRNKIATLNFITGVEPTRARICKIMEKFPDKSFPDPMKEIIKNRNFNTFQITDTTQINDSYASYFDLNDSLKLRDVTIYLEKDEMESLPEHIENFAKKDNELSLDIVDCVDAEDDYKPNAFENFQLLFGSPQSNKLTMKPTIRVEPSLISFTKVLEKIILTIYNLTSTIQIYQMSSNRPKFIKFDSSGQILPGKEKNITISLTFNESFNKTLLSVYVENYKIDIPVLFIKN